MFVSEAPPKTHILIGSVVKFGHTNGGHKVSSVFPGKIGVVVDDVYTPQGVRRWLVYHPDIKWVNKVTAWDSDSLIAQPQDQLDPKGYYGKIYRYHTSRPPLKAAVNDNF